MVVTSRWNFNLMVVFAALPRAGLLHDGDVSLERNRPVDLNHVPVWAPGDQRGDCQDAAGQLQVDFWKARLRKETSLRANCKQANKQSETAIFWWKRDEGIHDSLPAQR
jgi:hypothetical protein